MVVRLLLFFSILLISSTIHAQDEAKVRSVRFIGNNSFTRNELIDLVTLKPSGFLNRLIFDRKTVYFDQYHFDDDCQNISFFYMNEGFPDVIVKPGQLKLSKNGKRVKIVFNIEEGQYFSFNEVIFATHSDSAIFKGMSKKRILMTGDRFMSLPGSRFREESIRNDKLLITNIVSEQGYPYAKVWAEAIPDTVTYDATLKWHIDKGNSAFFGSTTISGDTSVSRHHITRQLRYKAGNRWTQHRIDLSQRSIYSLGVFRVVTVKGRAENDQPDTIPVSVYVKDAPRISSRFGIGYGKEERLRLFTELQLLRFPGGVSRMAASVRHSYIEPINVSVKFYQPAFPLRSTHLLVNPYFVMEREPVYELNRFGGEIGLMGQTGRHLSGNITFYSENIHITDMNKDAVYNKIISSKGYSKTGLSGGLVYSTLMPATDPESGISISGGAKWNGTLFDSRYPFLRLIAKSVYYHRISKTLLLATRAEAGTIKPTAGGSFIPVEERFFGGGIESLRGWARHRLGPVNDEGQQVGGLSSITITAEPRIRLTNSFALAIFADAGNVWRSSYSFPINDFRYSAGAGIRIKTPIGPVGIDAARPIFDQETKWRIHFNIGNPF
jgi:outer membrane protein insertion porin family